MPARIVTIVEYQPAWPGEFDVIAAELRGALGELAMRVDHIGSTAVPSLAAKDIIDIQVTVRDLGSDITEKMLAAGFCTHAEPLRNDHLPPGFDEDDQNWTKLFFVQRPGVRRCNIHVRRAGKPNQRYPLLVRDYLRADWRAAQAYGELKKRLAAALAEPDSYPEVKDPVADLIYLAAERWALTTGWAPEQQAPAGEA